VIQVPGFQDEDRDGGFELGGWTQPFSDAGVEARVVASVLAADALLLGRRSYELLSSFWPTADPTDVRTAKLNCQPKYGPDEWRREPARHEGSCGLRCPPGASSDPQSPGDLNRAVASSVCP
jgi:hypothetical protein